MAHVLIVEDEMSIADTLVFALSAEGFTSEWVRLGREAVARVARGGVDFVILDIGLPDVSGLEACKAIRRQSEVPVLFLTARAEEIDRVVGLEIGADDYVVKPFSPREVTARVRVILKRTGAARPATSAATGAADTAATPATAPQPLAAPPPARTAPTDFQVDGARHGVSYAGRPLELTASEYRLFVHLFSHPERVFSRQQLLDAIGGGEGASYERNIDGHIRSLRAKIRELAPERDAIQTHRGFGYSYRPERTPGGA